MFEFMLFLQLRDTQGVLMYLQNHQTYKNISITNLKN